jgi:hypothetical protein
MATELFVARISDSKPLGDRCEYSSLARTVKYAFWRMQELRNGGPAVPERCRDPGKKSDGSGQSAAKIQVETMSGRDCR